MADPEIEVIRGILKSQPRPADLAQRRDRLDALGARYPVPSDVQIRPVDANGVAAECTTTPDADTKRIKSFCGAKPPQKLRWTNARRWGAGGAMEISPRTLVVWPMIAGHEARSERHDARITVGSLPFCTVDGVIWGGVRGIGLCSDSGSPWRAETRSPDQAAVEAGGADHGPRACCGESLRMKISRPC
jgi:hypothetical protein